MKRFLAVGFLVVLAAVTALTWNAGTASAARFRTIPVKWAAGADTTFLEDESDTTRTAAIDMSDWDIPNGLANTTNNLFANVAFVVSGASNGAADSIYYCVEKSWDGTNWTQGSLAAAAGSCAVPVGGMGATVPMTFAGTLILDTDTVGANSILPLVPRLIRLKVAGDQGGTTPMLSRVRVYVTYPTLFDY